MAYVYSTLRYKYILGIWCFMPIYINFSFCRHSKTNLKLTWWKGMARLFMWGQKKRLDDESSCESHTR